MPFSFPTLPSKIEQGPHSRFLATLRQTLDTILRPVINRLNELETEGYITASSEYQSSWESSGYLSSNFSYARNHNLVEVIGSCKKLSGSIAFLQTILQLPEGYVPQATFLIPVFCRQGASWTGGPVNLPEFVAVLGKASPAVDQGKIVWLGGSYTQTGSDAFDIAAMNATFKVG